jgi:hypothetical protein
MVIRLTAFYQSLAEGQFPVRFLGRLNNSYGYPVANFLYPGFLYIGSILHALGFGFVDSVKIILAGSIVGAAVALFFTLRRLAYNALATVAGVAAFVFTPYVGYDLYHRGSVGEILGFFAASLVVWAMVAGNRIILPLAVAFLIVAHNTLALLILLVAGLYIALRREWKLVGGVLLGLGISAFFWVPAILEQRFVPFGQTVIANPGDYFPISAELLASGLATLLSAVILLFARRRGDERFWLAILIVAAFLATGASAIFWRLLPLGPLVQFPYRWLGVVALVSPIVVAGAIRVAGKRGVLLFAVFVVLWAVVAARILVRVSPIHRAEGFYTTNEGTTTVANEYMPVWVRELPKVRTSGKIELASGDAEVHITQATTQTISATVDAATQAVVQINTIFYPGWGVIVDGEKKRIDYGNPQGFMRVFVPSGTHTLFVQFRETPMRFAADAVSLLSLVWWGVLAVVRRKR